MGKETYETVVPGLTPPQKEEKEGQETDNASAVEPKKEVVQPTQQIESVQPTATTTPKTTDNTDAKQSSDVTQSKDKVNPYTVVPPPEQPDNDAIEKGIEDKDKEQRKADAKRQRSRAIITAVGDGLSALSNLYYTTRYAPNMNTGKGELSAKNVERWDKYVKERDAKLAEYKKTAIERAEKKYENDYTRWKDKTQYELKAREDRRKEEKAEIEERKREAEILFLAEKIKTETYNAMIRALEAGNMPEYLRLKNEVLISEKEKNESQKEYNDKKTSKL